MNTATADRTAGPSTLSQRSSLRSAAALLVHAYGITDSRHVATRDPEYAALLAAAFRDAGYLRVEVEAA